MTNKQILEIALQQSAYDCNCSAADFALKENVVTISRANPKARRYMPLPLECDLVSYGNNIVAQYFMPDVTQLKELERGRDSCILQKWSNRLTSGSKERGGSADCEMIYQIGVDVLPEYRQKGGVCVTVLLCQIFLLCAMQLKVVFARCGLSWQRKTQALCMG